MSCLHSSERRKNLQNTRLRSPQAFHKQKGKGTTTRGGDSPGQGGGEGGVGDQGPTHSKYGHWMSTHARHAEGQVPQGSTAGTLTTVCPESRGAAEGQCGSAYSGGRGGDGQGRLSAGDRS